MKFRDKLINMIWEFPCPLCDCDQPQIHDYNTFCAECVKKLPLCHGKRCPGCGGELDGAFELCSSCLKMPPRPWHNAMTLMKMTGLAENVVYGLKFFRILAMSRGIAELAVPLLSHPDFANVDMLVPVPLHWQREWQRSYNQAEVLARILGKKLNKPCKKVLKRIRPTTRQATLNREERLKNLKNAFAVPETKVQLVAGKQILLIDDVLTTGATLHACAEELLKNGAAGVVVFTIARR